LKKLSKILLTAYSVWSDDMKTFLYSVLFIVAAVIAGFAISTIRLESRASKPASEVQISQSLESDYEYILKASNNKLEVYKKGETIPEMSFDVYLQHLPKYDQEQLANGIYVKDYKTLLGLIDDYTS